MRRVGVGSICLPEMGPRFPSGREVSGFKAAPGCHARRRSAARYVAVSYSSRAAGRIIYDAHMLCGTGVASTPAVTYGDTASLALAPEVAAYLRRAGAKCFERLQP